jgi:hypothetical protein
MGARECVLRATSIDQVLASLSTWNSKGAPFVTGTNGEIYMRNILFFLTLAAGLAIAGTSSAAAMPTNVAAMKEVAASSSSFEPTRWRRWPRGHTKCYREFVIGPYSCHWFPL